ncbi:hypothetical protein B6N60_03122 [Richelia sinica FACHB-800]|uniref:Uncharacterized protein n=1 Tax=Richelia sinica FACHB-800 TaxID=1357546 RepID=A0A975Y5N8_9NOST|nr:hypothetical protein [Richelia sinica]MBD2663260.1 hypothetical protein [Richelia sinica FACHB-800]QXE24417.1 hypothetical protein B6N60_03122 [Richelia sinica FACHB-800]
MATPRCANRSSEVQKYAYGTLREQEYASGTLREQESVGAGLQISSTMNENFGKPARTGVCLRQAARTEV